MTKLLLNLVTLHEGFEGPEDVIPGAGHCRCECKPGKGTKWQAWPPKTPGGGGPICVEVTLKVTLKIVLSGTSGKRCEISGCSPENADRCRNGGKECTVFNIKMISQ